MEKNSRISISQIAGELGYSTTAIENNINWLKKNACLKRQGDKKSGHWEVLK